jgi:AbrB family looped-hinge helix DNA binding protein
MSDEYATRVIQLPARGQITIPSEFRRSLGLTDGSLLQMRLVGDKIEIRSLRVADPLLREYTEAEMQQFLEEDKIDEATAAAVRRLLVEGAL